MIGVQELGVPLDFIQHLTAAEAGVLMLPITRHGPCYPACRCLRRFPAVLPGVCVTLLACDVQSLTSILATIPALLPKLCLLKMLA